MDRSKNKGLVLSGLTERANAAADVATSIPATRLLKRVGLLPHPPSPDLTLLDNACGNLNLIYQFLKRWDGENHLKEVKAGDNSEEMVGHARERLRENGEGDEQLRGLTVDLHTWDAHALPLDDESVDYALLNFGPQLMRDGEAALKEMYRVLKPGGAFGYTVWIKAGWIKIISGAHLNLPRPLPAQWEDQSKNAAFLSSSAFDFKPDSIKQEYFEFDTVHQDVDGLLELMQVLVGSKLREADWETFVEFVKGESEGKEGFEMHWGALVVWATKA